MAVPVVTKNIIKETLGEYKYGFKTDNKAVFKAPKGLSKELVEEISKMKKDYSVNSLQAKANNKKDLDYKGTNK